MSSGASLWFPVILQVTPYIFLFIIVFLAPAFRGAGDTPTSAQYLASLKGKSQNDGREDGREEKSVLSKSLMTGCDVSGRKVFWGH